MNILIVGAGNMGSIYITSFLNNHLLTKEQLYILEHSEQKTTDLQQEGYSNAYHQPGEWIKSMDLIFLAIKPQDAEEFFNTIRAYLTPAHLLISIMAGISIDKIKRWVPTTKIIRAMPNLPAQIGMGMTGFTAAASVDKKELFIVQNLINTTGKSLYFEDEEKLNAVTAISGSGPAYVFYFMQAMMDAAQQMGFSQSEAELLVEQTFMGAVHLENRSQASCNEWIKRVSSKGGTTEAAITRFGHLTLDKHIQEGLKQALQRSIELGK
ncbi:pyrroline-5-carboxylate reductase [uncultured Microscilla sp.]|uniref:pyrroline-5-carboxylate reductase n=1 Tax=uncultured Microscilla sp. TaxID=432653 RepID=UPI00261ABD50|nr:pyrroline-5-carboxylate reductase [uncultured Microscilla sp.]